MLLQPAVFALGWFSHGRGLLRLAPASPWERRGGDAGGSQAPFDGDQPVSWVENDDLMAISWLYHASCYIYIIIYIIIYIRIYIYIYMYGLNDYKIADEIDYII